MPADADDAAPPLDAAALAARLKAARTAAGLTQRALAKKAGVSPSMVIARMESGQPNNWHPITLVRVALGLGKSWNYFGARPPPDIPPDTPGYNLCVARLAKGLTLAELSTAAGITRETLIRLEHGDQSGQVQTWQTISRALDIPLADLFQIPP